MVAWFALPSHLAARQIVLLSYFEHSPIPSQRPSVPQLLVAVTGHSLRGSIAPAATGVHLPRAIGLAQVWQDPAQAFSQQTPSTQKFDSHSLLTEQVWPGPNFPQLPFSQALPVTHWSPLVQTRTQSPF